MAKHANRRSINVLSIIQSCDFFNLSLLVISNFENKKKYILLPKTIQSLTKIVSGTSGSIIIHLEWFSVVKII